MLDPETGVDNFEELVNVRRSHRGGDMSGGRWQYSGYGIKVALDTIAYDEEVKARWPLIATALAGRTGSDDGLARVLYNIEHDMDYCLSSDTQIPDDEVWQRNAVWNLLRAILIAAPDPWFPRGKWATIQAVQDRVHAKS